FAGGWDTNCLNHKPLPLGPRRATETMVQIGTFAKDLPPSHAQRKEVIKNPALPSPIIPAHRRHGAPAFVKPNANWDAGTLHWMWVDAKSRGVNPKYIQLRNGLTYHQARAEAVVHWDKKESRRIREWNSDMAVFWARNRLLRYLRS